jgi:GT2 family glycosyltransferase
VINSKILIIILNWNDWKNTINCYKKLSKGKYSNFDLLIIDNGSSSFNYQKIKFFFKEAKKINFFDNCFAKKKKSKNIFLIKNNRNLGLTKGINIGFKFAIKNYYKFVIRMDNDTEITKNCLNHLVDTFANQKVVAASPKILHWYRKNVVWYMGFHKSWGYLKFQKTMNLKKRVIIDNPNLQKEKNIEVDAIAGALSMYKVSALKKSGLGDEDFFYGPEDIELSYRLKKIGRLICNTKSIAFHKIAKSEKYEREYKRIFYNLYGFLLLIKKIGNTYDRLFGYTFFLSRYFVYKIFKYKNKSFLIGYKLALEKFFKFKIL